MAPSVARRGPGQWTNNARRTVNVVKGTMSAFLRTALVLSVLMFLTGAVLLLVGLAVRGVSRRDNPTAEHLCALGARLVPWSVLLLAVTASIGGNGQEGLALAVWMVGSFVLVTSIAYGLRRSTRS